MDDSKLGGRALLGQALNNENLLLTYFDLYHFVPCRAGINPPRID